MGQVEADDGKERRRVGTLLEQGSGNRSGSWADRELSLGRRGVGLPLKQEGEEVPVDAD